MREDWDVLLPQTAQAMLDAVAEKRSPLPVLQERCPTVHEQVVAVGAMPDVLGMWGLSLNFDEFARKQIVDPAILQLLGDLAGVDMSGEALHAGLQHTYGYLFSLIETPFGYKRDRWVSTKLAEHFGLPPLTFTPGAPTGALLLNITYFLGRIAFWGRWRYQHRLRQLHPHLPQALQDFPFKELQCWRITEAVTLPALQGKAAKEAQIHTDLLLPPGAAEEPQQLLLYWLENSRGEAQLITAFMVSPEMVEKLLCEPQIGRVSIPLRYNAFLPGFGEQPLEGKRSVRRIL